MKTSYILVALFAILNQSTFAQINRAKYCQCDIKGEKNVANRTIGDSFFINAIYEKQRLKIEIFNNTKDTAFLFKSYFDFDISRSKYIYRYNKKRDEIDISFLPLIPYLYAKYSDKIIFQDRIIKDYQTVYDFYKIPPLFTSVLYIDILDLTKETSYIETIETDSLNKFQKIKKFKDIDLNRKRPKRYFVEFAYYKNVSILCNENSYFLDEINFNDQARSYKKIKTQLVLAANDKTSE